MLITLSVVLLAVLAALLFAMRLAVADLLPVGLVAAGAVLVGNRVWWDALAGGLAFKSADENIEAIGHRSVLPPPGESGVKFAVAGFVPHCGEGKAISSVRPHVLQRGVSHAKQDGPQGGNR
ncbi:exported hypothetical protein [Mesorhizobium plurifarium]|uniref:Uncharacterized protein n=1 Tax=Mesorhizobium plurifarium TaxID=69974 RepID=A0A090EBV6_MESPL|nr:exported hypothetical protein [Mesorhizobium plurifarium]